MALHHLRTFPHPALPPRTTSTLLLHPTTTNILLNPHNTLLKPCRKTPSTMTKACWQRSWSLSWARASSLLTWTPAQTPDPATKPFC
jgi:hypothetical protein